MPEVTEKISLQTYRQDADDALPWCCIDLGPTALSLQHQACSIVNIIPSDSSLSEHQPAVRADIP